MKKLSMMLVVAVASLGLVGAASARKGHWKHKRGHQKMMMKMLKKLGVKDDVLKQIGEKAKAYRAAKKAAKKEMKGKKKALHALLSAATLDNDAITKLAGEIGAYKAKKFTDKVAHMAEIAALLTPEQRTQVHTMMKKMGKRWKRWKGKHRRRGKHRRKSHKSHKAE